MNFWNIRNIRNLKCNITGIMWWQMTKKLKPLWKASTRFHLFLNRWNNLSFPQQQQFQCCALLEADMFRHVLPGNNNTCLICHEIMKRDPAGYLTGCRLMVYYMGVKHKAGGPRTGPAQTLWAGFDPLTAGFTAFLTHSHSCYTKLTIKWQKLLTFHDQI